MQMLCTSFVYRLYMYHVCTLIPRKGVERVNKILPRRGRVWEGYPPPTVGTFFFLGGGTKTMFLVGYKVLINLNSSSQCI